MTSSSVICTDRIRFRSIVNLASMISVRHIAALCKRQLTVFQAILMPDALIYCAIYIFSSKCRFLII